MLLQFQVAPLDLRQHAIEFSRQQSELVVTKDFSPDRIVALAGNRFGGLYQLKDRFGDGPLKARGQQEGHAERDHQSQDESDSMSSQSRMQSSQIRFNVQDPTGSPASRIFRNRMRCPFLN